MKKNTTITLLILLVILLLTAWVVYLVQQRSAERTLLGSEAATAFNYGTSTTNFTDFDGNQTNLAQFLGKTLVVNSWASWAPASVNELKLLTTVAKDYKEQGVIVIGINRAETRTTAEAFLNTLGLTDEVLLIVDADDRYYGAIGGFSMPETVIYDTKGNIVKHKRGQITEAELTLVLDEALAQTE
jgi:thiol-disulfide isomerase/thioredoxin